MRQAGLGAQVDLVKEGKCPICKKDVLLANLELAELMKTPKLKQGFKDELSYKEFKISGMCQYCQDETFGGPDDE